MTRRSLRWELAIAATSLIALALLLGGIGLLLIFDKVLDTRTSDELNHTARFLAGQVDLAADGTPTLRGTPADPRYATPYGGLYWQVETASWQALRSRSLWDKTLELPEKPSSVLRHHQVLDLAGPDGGQLLAVLRTVELAGAKPELPLLIVVAMDRRELAASRRTFLELLIPSLVALGLVLALAMLAFLRRALSPFRALRAELRDVHDGRRTRLPSRFPEEVQPLVDDLNRLIGVQEKALEQARTQAGDMAHGLKTPLAVLTALARRTEASQPALAREIDEQATAMGRQVDRALMRARVAAAGGLQRRSCTVAPVVHRVRAALGRLPGAEALDWRIDVPDTVTYPADEGDVTEMLGTLLDNARKWGRGQVRVVGTGNAAGGSLTVEDDGPGMTDEAMSTIGRGQRWDESTPGTGFGMAIARDLAAATGGALRLSRSELGGLKVEIRWPARGDT